MKVILIRCSIVEGPRDTMLWHSADIHKRNVAGRLTCDTCCDRQRSKIGRPSVILALSWHLFKIGECNAGVFCLPATLRS